MFDFSKNIFGFRQKADDIPDNLLKTNKISGVIDKIIFYNQENNFSIFKFNISSSTLKITAKGKIIEPRCGMLLELDGYWNNDKIHGIQFSFTECKTIEPTTCEAIIKYLGSGLVKNIGIKTAEKIVAVFGAETLQIIENFPQRLKEVPSVGESKKNAIIQGYKNHLELKKIMLFLAEHNISIKFSHKLFKNYGTETIRILKENPYVLIKDIKGVGFKKADDIAVKLGLAADDEKRIINGIYYILNEAADKGHTYLPLDKLKESAFELLKIELLKIEKILADASVLNENEIFLDETRLYLKWNYFCEQGIATRLTAISNARIISQCFNESELETEINKFAETEKIKLSATQQKVIKSAVLNKVFVLTGGPGTGKTTITNFIVKLFKKKKLTVMLCSPTGRAAKRLSELTFEPAQTIHRLLEYSPQLGFQRNEKNKLNTGVLIIDEFSMVDLTLFYNLLKALKDETVLILIGDSNQLPSVGAGNLLNDIIRSKKIETGILKDIFRQDEKSLIILNAHNIIKTKNLIIKNYKDSDFFVINKEEKKDTLAEIIDLFSNRLPKFGFSQDNIQILAPIYKGILGVDNLNIEIKKKISGASKNTDCFFQYGNTFYSAGDRIIQLKNNYTKQIMNGDIGKILAAGSSIDELINSAADKNLIKKYIEKNKIEEINSALMIAQFDDLVTYYTGADADECSLAYAVTVHKSQGSEFDCIILPMCADYYINLNRNLIYTAITRAKKMCVIIGKLSIFFSGIKKNLAEKRFSYLSDRLITTIKNSVYALKDS